MQASLMQRYMRSARSVSEGSNIHTGLTLENNSSFEFISLRAIEVFLRPPAPVYSLISTLGLYRLGMGVSLRWEVSSGSCYPRKAAAPALDPPKHPST